MLQLFEYLTTRLPTPQLTREQLAAFIADIQARHASKCRRDVCAGIRCAVSL